MNHSMNELKQRLQDLKQKIIETEQAQIKLSEQDTRQGLINPLFEALGWDFSDFRSIRSELRHKKYNNPVDYAFYNSQKNSTKNQDKNTQGNIPILLLEAKALGTDPNKPRIVKQLCAYLGEMGVQWGVITDGNKYVMYNSRSGASFEDQKFITLQIKTFDTDDGIPLQALAEKFFALLSRKCLENVGIQETYETVAMDRQIEDAWESLLTEPFDTLASAIRKEFKQDRVKVDQNLKVTLKQIISYFENRKDDEGRIQFDYNNQGNLSDAIMHKIVELQQGSDGKVDTSKLSVVGPKRISVRDLLKSGFLEEGDPLRLEFKGEVAWGRVTGNGEIEVGGKVYTSPSRAGQSVTDRSCNGWTYWQYRDKDEWKSLGHLRTLYMGQSDTEPKKAV